MHPAPPQRQRALIFRLPGEESARNAHSLAGTATKAGMDVVMMPYWPDGQAEWASEQPLLPVDIGSAPRLSEFALFKRYGLKLDLLDLQAHSFATEAITPDLILPESVWQQRLRGIASILMDRLDQERPDIIFIAHGAEVVSRIITAVAAFRGIPSLFWESGFFPDHLYLDACAPHFFRGLNASDRNPLPQVATEETNRFIDQWRSARLSKYDQSATDAARFSQWKAQDDRPILLVAGQISTDANAVVGLGAADRLHDLYRNVLRLPDDWRMVFKPHPLRPDDIPPLSDNSDSVFIGDIGLRDALDSADAVLVHSSNVGLEALMLGKPVLTTGDPIYSAHGTCAKVTSADELHARLLSLPTIRTTDQVAALVENIRSHSLLAGGDTATLNARVSAARPPAIPRLSRYYSRNVRLLIAALRHLFGKLKRFPVLGEAVHNLPQRSQKILLKHIDATVLGGHRYGGPPRPLYIAAPYPLHSPRRKHLSLSVRLDECAYPVEYLRSAMLNSDATYAVGCIISPHQDDAGAQAFTRVDIEWIAAQLERSAEIVCEPEMDDNGAYLATVFLRPKTLSHVRYQTDRYGDWRIPLEAFSVAEDVQRKRGGQPVLSGETVHAIYGPYLPIPAGRWRVSWAPHPLNLPERLRYLFFKALRRNLHLEVITHAHGDTLIQSVPFAKLATDLVARAGAAYEFRTNWNGPRNFTPSRSPTFNGVVLKHRR